MMDFLYFPDNKLEYLPAFAFLLITLAGAMFTMMFIVKNSQKEALKAKELEKKIMESANGKVNGKLERSKSVLDHTEEPKTKL